MNSMVLWSQVKSCKWINEVRLWQIISDNSTCLQESWQRGFDHGCLMSTLLRWTNPQRWSGWCFGTWLLLFHILGRIFPTDSFFQRGRSSTNQWLLLSPDRKPVQHGSSLFWVSQGGACWKHCITQRNIGKRSDTDDLCLKQSNSVQYYSKTVAFIVFR